MESDFTCIAEIFSPRRRLQICVDPEVQRRLMQMSNHRQSSSFPIVELTTNVAIIVQVAVVISECLIIRVLIGIIMLTLVLPSGQERHSHLGFCRKVSCKTDVFSRQQFRPYPYRDGWRSSVNVREVGRQLRRVRSGSAHSPAVESRHHAKLCGNSVLDI